MADPSTMQGQGVDHKRWTLSGDFVRFLVAGGLNAGLTLLIYQALLFITPHNVAYSLAWIAGVLFVVIVYPSRVFPDGRKSMTDRLLLGASYIAVFAFGLAILELLTREGMPPRLGIFIVMAATTATNFAFGRLLLRRE